MNRREKETRQRKRVDASAWAKEKDGTGATSIKLEGVEPYKLEVGVHQVDFMPYIAGKRNRKADEGFEHFECTYGVHRVPMPSGSKEWYLCSWDCFKKPCAICKWMQQNGRTADPELLKALKVSTRHLWIVNDKPGDTKNKLKVLDTNHFNKGSGFGEMMKDAMNAVPKNAMFADLEKGLIVQLTVKEDTYPGGKYNKVTRIDFLPRDYEYPESMLDKAPCLDEFLVEPDYDSLEELMNQSSPDDEEHDNHDQDEEETPPVRRRQPAAEENEDEPEEPVTRRRRPAEDEETEEEPTPPKRKGKSVKEYGMKLHDFVMYENPETEEEVECEIIKISADGLTMVLEDQDGQSFPGVRPDKVTLCDTPETAEEEETPAPRDKGKPTGKKSAPVEEEDVDWEEEEEPDPKPHRRR